MANDLPDWQVAGRQTATPAAGATATGSSSFSTAFSFTPTLGLIYGVTWTILTSGAAINSNIGYGILQLADQHGNTALIGYLVAATGVGFEFSLPLSAPWMPAGLVVGDRWDVQFSANWLVNSGTMYTSATILYA